ncbi:MAG: uncharacterized protein JWP01_1725 [Myxococcales bacterium]|nr:uncharacterized protein [Myxococcales bacterium]
MVRLVITLALAVTVATAHASSAIRGIGMYPTANGAATTAASLPMLDSKVEVTIRGPIVETVVTQKFANRSDRAIEATYIFPLPVDAAVSALWLSTGTRTIRGAIEKRDDAQRRYEAAVRQGVAAAVLDQERPDVFTQTVAAIPARGTVEVTLRYDTVARFADGRWELALPMVVAPRYVPGTVSGRPTTGTGRAPDTNRAPDASRVTPQVGPNAGGATTVALAFVEPVTDVTSPTHELAGKASAFTFTDLHSDHDAVIRWRAKSTAAGWIEVAGAAGYAAVVVEAPAAPTRKGPTRAMLVLDRAATIKGDALVVVQPFVRGLFAALGTADRIAVLGADSATWRSPAEALRLVEQTWTRPGQPFDLTRVLEAAKPDGAALVLISDGLVADDRAAIAAAKRLGVAIHVIGVGPAPARGLLTQIAAATGGTIRFALPSDDLTAAAKATLADVASPPAPLTVSWGTLAASDVVPSMLPRLGAGQAMLVLARVKRAQTANARARGELFSLETTSPSPKLDGAITTAGPLARRWARVRLDDLLVGPHAPHAVTAHALSFGLVSPYTSLVAIGTEVVVEGGVKHSVSVPVSVPSGMSWIDVKRETTLDTTLSSGDELTKQDEPANPARPTKKVNKPVVAIDDTRRSEGGEAPPMEDSDDEGADAESPSPAPAPASGSVATMDASSPMEEYEALAETTSLGSRRRAVRIAASIGGGVAIQDQESAPLLSIGARLEVGRRTMLGAESTLWLVDGLHGQGRFLVTFARRGIARWLELGGGLGAHLGGTGVGGAASLSVRLHLPPAPAISTYLRYDAALLTRFGEVGSQHTLTLGLERSF